jgi:hypothetical protein
VEEVIEYRHLDYEVLIHKSQHHAAMRWCDAQYGVRWEALDHREGRWSIFWAGRDHYDKYRFCFALEQDMLLFTLRWA